MNVSWFVLGCALLFVVEGKAIGKSKKFFCSKATPCAWQVYKPYDRTPLYFMQSPCQCPAGSKCVQSKDDISISAYVYLCETQR